MTVKEFHILLQDGCLLKNMKVLTDAGYALSNAEVYWTLTSKGFICITKNIENKPLKIELKDIYYFCPSTKY